MQSFFSSLKISRFSSSLLRRRLVPAKPALCFQVPLGDVVLILLGLLQPKNKKINDYYSINSYINLIPFSVVAQV